MIDYKADDGWSLKPEMIQSKLSQLMALRVGYSNIIAQHLINHLHDHHSFEFDATKTRTSDAFFFKKKHMPAINASQSKMQGNTVSEYHRDLVLLKWQSLVMATLMNVGLNNMSKWNQTQAEVLKLAQNYVDKTTTDLEDECRQKKQLMDVRMTQRIDIGDLRREIRSLKKALTIKSRAQVISSYNKQRAKISTMHWLRFCYLLLIKKRMLETFIQRLDSVPLLE